VFIHCFNVFPLYNGSFVRGQISAPTTAAAHTSKTKEMRLREGMGEG